MGARAARAGAPGRDRGRVRACRPAGPGRRADPAAAGTAGGRPGLCPARPAWPGGCSAAPLAGLGGRVPGWRPGDRRGRERHRAADRLEPQPSTRRCGRSAVRPALTSAYLAACMSLVGLVAAAYAVSAVLRLRSDEAGQPGRAACWRRAVSRLRWGSSYLLAAPAGTAVVLAGGRAWDGPRLRARQLRCGHAVPRLIGAGARAAACALAVAAVGAALIGLLPRWSGPAAGRRWRSADCIGVFGPAAEPAAGSAGYLAVHACAEAAWRRLHASRRCSG